MRLPALRSIIISFWNTDNWSRKSSFSEESSRLNSLLDYT